PSASRSYLTLPPDGISMIAVTVSTTPSGVVAVCAPAIGTGATNIRLDRGPDKNRANIRPGFIRSSPGRRTSRSDHIPHIAGAGHGPRNAGTRYKVHREY